MNENNTKYMHVTRNPIRDRVRQNETIDNYNFKNVKKINIREYF